MPESCSSSARRTWGSTGMAMGGCLGEWRGTRGGAFWLTWQGKTGGLLSPSSDSTLLLALASCLTSGPHTPRSTRSLARTTVMLPSTTARTSWTHMTRQSTPRPWRACGPTSRGTSVRSMAPMTASSSPTPMPGFSGTGTGCTREISSLHSLVTCLTATQCRGDGTGGARSWSSGREGMIGS